MTLPSFRQTFFNISSLWFNKVAAVIASFFITGLATRYYGLEQMGLFLLAVNACAYVALFDFGASSALPRVVPGLRAQGKDNEVNALVSTAYYASWSVALLGVILTALLFCASALGIAMLDGIELRTAALYALAFGVSFVGLAYRAGYGLLAAVHRFDVYSTIDTLVLFFKAAYVVVLIYVFNGDLLWYAWGALIFPFAANYIQYRKGLQSNNIALRLRFVSRSSLNLLLSHCGASLLITFASMMLIQGSTLVAGHLQTSYAALFGFPMQMVISAMSLSVSIGAMLSPVASSLHGKNDATVMANVSMQSVRLASALSVMLALLLLTVGPWLMKLWLGGGKVEASSLNEMIGYMKILAIGSVFLTPGVMLRGVLLGTGRQWSVAWIELLCSAAGILVGWFLLFETDAGLVGLVCGVVVSYVLRGVIVLPLVAMRSIDLPFGAMVRQGLLWPCAIGALAYAAAMVINPALPEQDMLTALLRGTIASVIWLAGTWFFVLQKSEKEDVVMRVKRLWQRR